MFSAPALHLYYDTAKMAVIGGLEYAKDYTSQLRDVAKMVGTSGVEYTKEYSGQLISFIRNQMHKNLAIYQTVASYGVDKSILLKEWVSTASKSRHSSSISA